MDTKGSYRSLDYEIDFLKIYKNIKENYIKVISITLLFGFFGLFSTFFIPKTFKSTVTLEIAEQISGGSQNSFGNLSLSGLAGGLIGNSSPQLQVISKKIQSRNFILSYLKKYDEDQLVFKQNIYKTGNKDVYVREFLKYFKTLSDDETSLLTLSFEHTSPVIAKNTLENIVSEFNLSERTNEMQLSQKMIDSLMEDLIVENSSETRSFLNQIYIHYLQKLKISSVKEDYALEVIDPAFIPELHEFPRKSLFAIFGMVLGLILSSIFVNISSKKDA